ncbi:hypothetical protein BGZ90_004820 [Linnemannia elongata]|nr:hypothetical protein BGZ90_004820 [Linnemannia elongata]
MAYSPDGQRLVLGTDASSIMLWDLQSNKPDVKLEGHTDDVSSVAFSACGKWILSGSDDKTARLWSGEVDSWSCVAVVSGCSEAVASVAWNPVVPMEFATGCRDGSVQVWRISGAKEGNVAVQLHWSSHIGQLCASGLAFKGAAGLSPTYRKLLVQRGAIDDSLLPEGDEPEQGNVPFAVTMKLPNIINMIMDFGKCSYSLKPFLFRSIKYFISTRLSNTLYSTMSPIRKRKNSKVDDTNREITIDLVIDEGKTMASLVATVSPSSKIEPSHLEWLIKNIDEFAGRSVKAINELITYTLKLMKPEPERYKDPERIEARQQWAKNVPHDAGNMNHFVYVDEVSSNLHITRKYGRTPRGKSFFQRVPTTIAQTYLRSLQLTRLDF